MSRIGKRPVELPGGVEASVSGQTIEVKGPKGTRPPKSQKTERSPMKPGATPKPKSSGEPSSKPHAKAVWKKDAKPATEAYKPRKPKPGKPTKPKGTGTSPAPGKKAYTRAGDTSKRFTPPNKIGKQGGKGGPKSK